MPSGLTANSPAPDELHSGKLKLHKVLVHNERWVRGSGGCCPAEIVGPVCAAIGTVAVAVPADPPDPPPW